MFRKRWVLIIALTAVLGTGCNSEEAPQENALLTAAEEKLKEYRIDFAVQPETSKLLVESWPHDFPSAKWITPSKIELKAVGGSEPYRVEVIEGKASVEARGLKIKATRTPGLAVLRITDAKDHVSHAVIEVAAVPVLKIEKPKQFRNSEFELRPCEPLPLLAEGGFPPYRYETSSSSAVINPEQTHVSSRLDSATFQLKVTDSQGNSNQAKLVTHRSRSISGLDYCFGINGRLGFPLSSPELSKNRPPRKNDKHLAFIPAAAAFGKERQIVVAGTEFPNNDFYGTTFRLEGMDSNDLEEFRKRHPLQISVRRYDAQGAVDNSFGEKGVFVYSGHSEEITRGEKLQILEDGSILISGVSFRADGTRLVLIKLTPAGQLDTTFGEAGAVYTGLYGKLPWKLTNGLAELKKWDSPVSARKLMVLKPFSPEKERRILLQIDYLRETEYGSLADERTDVLAFRFDGKIDSGFGSNGLIQSSDESVTVEGYYRGAKRFLDVTLSEPDRDQILALEKGESGVIATIKAFDPKGFPDSSFGNNGEIVIKDPFHGKRPSASTGDPENPQVEHDGYLLDLLASVSLDHLTSGLGGSIVLTGKTMLNENTGFAFDGRMAVATLTQARERRRKGRYNLSWEFLRFEGKYLFAVEHASTGNFRKDRPGSEAEEQQIIMGSLTTDSRLEKAELSIVRTGISMHHTESLKGYVSHWKPRRIFENSTPSDDGNVIQLVLGESDPAQNKGANRDRLLILTHGAIYQYVL